jgi:hypothetical protein
MISLRATLPDKIFNRDFAFWTVHFVNICVKNKKMQQLFIQFIMYGISYMFRHYIAILRERSWCLLRDTQLRSSRWNIVDGRDVSSDVVRGDLIYGHVVTWWRH